MIRISRSASAMAAAASASAVLFMACYDPCDYPGETSAVCRGAASGAGAGHTASEPSNGCDDCDAMSTTCQPYACVEGACRAGDPAPVTVSCGDGDVCDGQGSCVRCNVDQDCQATSASMDTRCHEHACFSCVDGVQNGNEVGLDCGGSCLACTGASCSLGAECKSGSCAKGACLLPEGASCDDHAACATGRCDTMTHKCAACAGQAQCQSTQCSAGTCKAPHGAPCGTHADCAGGTCDASSRLCAKPNGDACGSAFECASGFCAGACAPCAADADCLSDQCNLATGTCALGQQAYCTPGVTACADGLACGGFPAKCQ